MSLNNITGKFGTIHSVYVENDQVTRTISIKIEKRHRYTAKINIL